MSVHDATAAPPPPSAASWGSRSLAARTSDLVGRPLFLPAIAAGTLAFLLLAALSFTKGTDYSTEAQPAFEALRHGHIGLFLERCPAYAGSLIVRAPLAILPSLWGGGVIAVYRAVSSPAVLLLLAYGLFLFATALEVGTSRKAAWLAMLLLLANPLAAYALLTGHSEEIIVAIGCIGAAFATKADRPVLTGLLLGLAIACKPWALVVFAPLLLALHTGRVRCALIAIAVPAVILLPLLIHGGQGLTTTATVAHSTGAVANPWQLWWFLGDHAGRTHHAFGRVLEYRTAPHWVTTISHPLVIVVPLAICLMRPQLLRDRPWHDLLLVLAALLFLRCLLDTWNHHYYALPAVIALGTWEVLALRRAPYLAWGITLLTLVTIVVMPAFASADVQSVVYLAWAMPLMAWLVTSTLHARSSS